MKEFEHNLSEWGSNFAKEVILVLGAGSFGTCLAEHLSRKGLSILIWDIEQKVCSDINNNKENNRYFPDIKLNQTIRVNMI